MKSLFRAAAFAAMPLLMATPSTLGGAMAAKPVTPDASPEATALLQFLYDISGKYTLTGQHNYPNVKGRNTAFATEYIGPTNLQRLRSCRMKIR